MRKKILSFVLAILLIVPLSLVLVACGDDGSSRETENLKFNVTVNISGDGMVTGAGEYETGEAIAIEAVPNEGSVFYKWNDGVTRSKRYVTIVEDIELTAIFMKGIEYTTDNGNKIKAYGNNIVVEETYYGITLKSVIEQNDVAYEVQGDWYEVNYGEVDTEPAGEYSYLRLSTLYNVNEYMFIEKEVEDYIFVRFPSFKGTHPRVGRYEEVIAGSDGIFSIAKNATKTNTLEEYDVYGYDIATNLDGANPSEDMYVYVQYKTDKGIEYRFVYEFLTCTFNKEGMVRDFHFAIGNKLFDVTVRHA